jgi:SH3-like domain-containing protein
MLSASAGAQAPAIGPDSERPVPRYVSLATDSANGRHGPGLDHKIDWIYQRAGLPLLVTAESGPWRRVTDPGGDQVWIHARNLEERRTALVRAQTPLRRTPGESASVVAVLGANLVAPLTGCDGGWRRMAISGRVGWVEADALWGAEDCAGL